MAEQPIVMTSLNIPTWIYNKDIAELQKKLSAVEFINTILKNVVDACLIKKDLTVEKIDEKTFVFKVGENIVKEEIEAKILEEAERLCPKEIPSELQDSFAKYFWDIIA